MNRRDLFLMRPDVQETLARAEAKVALARGKVSVLAQPKQQGRRNFLSLLGLVAISAAALLAGTSAADATVVFENVLFKATIGNANRTEAERWSDVKNVKDFGALGNSSHDDTPNIQAAVDYITSPFSSDNRGTIYFPPGRFVVTAPITYNLDGALSIVFRGEIGASFIVGNFAGFIFNRSLSATMDNPTSGGRVFEKLNIANGHAAGGGIRMGSTVCGAVRDCVVSAFRGIMLEDSDGGAAQSIIVENCLVSAGGLGGATIGIAATANVVISACDFNGIDKAIECAATSGAVIQACRIEQCVIGLSLGSDVSGAHPFLGGCVVLGGTIESCSTAINGSSLSNFLIVGTQIQGFNNSAPGGLNPQYGIRLYAETQNGVVEGVAVGGNYDIAGISIADTTNRGDITFISTRSGNVGLGVAWVLPSKAHTAQFINCDVTLTFTFANLPGAPLGGEKYNITDCATSTFLATAAGGGTGAAAYRLVRWNPVSSLWQVIG